MKNHMDICAVTPRGPALSAEEQDYLKTLFADDQERCLPAMALIPCAGDELLHHLPAMQDLHLSTRKGEHHFIFPIEVEGPHLRVGHPRIYDTRRRPRAWRAAANESGVEVTDLTGRFNQPRVIDLSFSGLALSTDNVPTGRPIAESSISLVLKLPESGSLAITGTVVRETVDPATHRPVLALKFTHLTHALEDAICAYLSRVHRARYAA